MKSIKNTVHYVKYQRPEEQAGQIHFMPDISYDVINNEKEMQFEIILDNVEKASLTYRFHKGDIALMHTTVPKAYEGRGIATALAKEAFGYAAQHKMPVMVYCPFVSSFLRKHTEYRQQLDPQYHRI